MHDTCEGYHEYRGGVLYCGGTQITKDLPPTVLMISSTCIMIFPTVLKITPTVLVISPTLLNTPMVFKISPTVLNIPQGAQDIPHMHHEIPATVLNTPTVLHTHYTGWIRRKIFVAGIAKASLPDMSFVPERQTIASLFVIWPSPPADSHVVNRCLLPVDQVEYKRL